MQNIQQYESTKHDLSKPMSYPGHCQIHEVMIAGVEFTNKAVSIVIFESLTNNFVSGEMLIADTQNLASNIPLVGGEEITMEIEDCYGKRETMKFYLTKVSNRTPVGPGLLSYSIHFGCKVFLLNALRKVSRAFQSSRTETAIDTILREYLEHHDIDVVQTSNNISCIIPNWRPLYALNWLASRSVSSQDEFASSPYLIFKERTGKMNLLPLDFLYSEATNMSKGELSIKYGRMTEDADPTIAQNERMGVHLYSFEDFKITKTTDFVENLLMGMYNNVVQEIDLFARDTNFFEYSYTNEFAKSQHLNKFPFHRPGMFSDGETSHWRSIPTHDGLFSDESASARIDSRTHQHVAKWQQTEQMVVVGKLNGSFDLRLGQKYRIDIPSYTSISTNTMSANDETFSGEFIVEMIKHEFTPGDKYYATVQLFTDSLSKEIVR